jgi:hypothetical protein
MQRYWRIGHPAAHIIGRWLRLGGGTSAALRLATGRHGARAAQAQARLPPGSPEPTRLAGRRTTMPCSAAATPSPQKELATQGRGGRVEPGASAPRPSSARRQTARQTLAASNHHPPLRPMNRTRRRRRRRRAARSPPRAGGGWRAPVYQVALRVRLSPTVCSRSTGFARLPWRSNTGRRVVSLPPLAPHQRAPRRQRRPARAAHIASSSTWLPAHVSRG